MKLLGLKLRKGSDHIACISDENHVFFWGSNKFGQCADTSSSLVPQESHQFTSALKISCGSYHTLLLSTTPLNQSFFPCENPNSKTLPPSCIHSSSMQKLEQDYKKLLEDHSLLQQKLTSSPSLPETSQSTKYLSPYFEVSFSELQIDPEPIGRGGYGTVFKGNFRGTTVAVKKLKLEDRPQRLGKSGKHSKVDDFLQECQTMMSVRHPNIVLFIGACTVQPELALVLEYCGNGSLWDVLRNHNTPLPWYLRCKIALDIARGVNYLHNFPRPVLHRDLKSLNILLDDAMNAKLADFGWTRFKAETMTNKIGTYQWMAPEVIQGQNYSEKADVYSFGIILWEIATRKPPFKDLSGVQVSQEVVKNHLRPAVTKRCPEPFAKLMQRCWDREPDSRPGFFEIILELEAFLKFIEKTAVS
jgi:mitogen-activated protein kinase kinase kinase 9